MFVPPFPRSSGILLHPTSFPSRFGIGDLGEAAYRFVDFLAESGQTFWQILPLGPTGYGNSPYSCYSALGGNPLLISLETLRDQQWLTHDDLAHSPDFPQDTVDFERVIEHKIPFLKKACESFKVNANPEQQKEFLAFCESKTHWLEDYALYMALKDQFGGVSWHTWDEKIAKRQPEALELSRRKLSAEIFYYKFVQFEFFREWTHLKKYANDRGIYILGDIPIYVAHDSADVWAHPEFFCLDVKTGVPAGQAGVPPDYFSETGQLWGNPVYLWSRLQKDNFKWWIQRFEGLLNYVDIIRIDHFRGFEAFWQVKMGETIAMKGKWVKAPGVALFEVVKEQLGELPIVAEDLGVITPEVEALRDQFGFPGMRVLQFAFCSDPGNSFLPFNYVRNCVVYSGTHDNDTTAGWFEKIPDWEKDAVLRYLGAVDPQGIHLSLIRLAFSSIANLAIIPLQDIFGWGSDARMNVPGKAEGNWGWRYRYDVLTWEVKDSLKTLVKTYRRDRA
jgi:4-alpha-glucanotransferase